MAKVTRLRLQGTGKRNSLIDALGDRFARLTAQSVVMGLPPYAALDAVQRGAGGMEQLRTLAHYVVFTVHLCNQGFVRDEKEVAARAQEALEEVASAYDGQSAPVEPFAEKTYRAFCECLSLFLRQVEATTPHEMVSAYRSFTARRCDALSVTARAMAH